MSKLTNKNLQRMIELMGNKKPINESISNSAVTLVKISPNGKSYGVVRENTKYFIKESNDGINFDFIGGIANKTKNQYRSYEEATKHLNLMFEDFNKSYGIQEGTDILSSDIIQEKRFVLKSKKKPADTGFDFGGGEEKGGKSDFDFSGSADNTGGTDFDFGGGEEKKDDFDFGTEDKGGDDFGSSEDDADLSGEDDDPIKSIQKMTGKLGQKIRDTEDLSSDTMKWVAKSIISALDLEAMDTEDKKDIIRAVKKKEDEGSDEEFDFMQDPNEEVEDDEDDWHPDTSFMDDNCPGCKGSGYNEDLENCVDCDGSGVTDDGTVNWTTLSDEEKQNIVNSTYGQQTELEFPEENSNEEPYVGNTGKNYDEYVDNFHDPEPKKDGNGNPIYTPEEFEEEEIFPGDTEEPIMDWDKEVVDNMSDYMDDEEEYGPGSDDKYLSDDEILLDDDSQEDYMDDEETYPYREVSDTNYMEDRNEDLNHTDYMATFSKEVPRHEKTRGRNLEPHEVNTHVRKLQNKLGGSDVVSVDGNRVVGDFGYIEVTSNGYTLYKEGVKFGKKFRFDELGKVKMAVDSTDYMTDYMGPKTAPTKPQTKPGPDVMPGKPDTDRPSPSKRPFTPPPHITPGEEPAPKARDEDYMDYMDYMADEDEYQEEVITADDSEDEQLKKDLEGKYRNRNVVNGIDYMDGEEDDKCPICNGRGVEKSSIGFGTKTAPKACEACGGTGIKNDISSERMNEPYNNNPFPYTSSNTLPKNDVKLNYSYRDGIDYMENNDEILNKRKSMGPKTAPTKPQTKPGPDVMPGKPDTDRPSPSKRPFTPPPHITPGEEPAPKAKGRNRF